MKTYREKLVEMGGTEGLVRGVLHLPFLNAHGTALLIPGYFSATKSGPTRLFVDLARHLQEMGLVVLRFDFRGMGDSDGESGEMSYNSALADIKTATKYLVDNFPNFRPTLIAHSMGGNCAVSAVIHHHIDAEALLLIAPDTSGAITKEQLFSDEQLDLLNSGQRVARRGVMCGAQFLQPILQKQIFEEAHMITTPCVFICGELDELYTRKDVDNLTNLMRSDVRIFDIPDGDHNFLNLHARNQLITLIGSLVSPSKHEISA